MNRFIFVTAEYNTITPLLLSDLRQLNQVNLLKGCFYFKSKFEKILYKLHNTHKINDYISLPYREIWLTKEHSAVYQQKYHAEDNYYIVVLNMAMPFISTETMAAIRDKFQAKIILLMFDPSSHNNTTAEAMKRLDEFDLVCTFDENDADRYGFIHFFQIYSMLIPNTEILPEHDLYFVGRDKNRMEMIYRCLDRFNRASLDSHVVIVGSKKRMRRNDVSYFRKPIAYEDTVRDMLNCNCIFEVLQPGQTGASARYVEAVCYNKKLLTNNVNIVNYPFYDSRYMKIFHNAEDIDCDWIREHEDIDYHYQNEFSPTQLLKVIEKECHST